MITFDQPGWVAAATLIPSRALLPCPPATDRAAWEQAASDGRIRDLLGRARADLPVPWPPVRATDWLRFTEDGNRTAYESPVFERHAMLSRAVVLAAATLEPSALDRVIDGVIVFCEQSSWSWSAHDDAPQRGERLPDVDRPYLDLGAGEVAAALAWTDHVLGEALEQRAAGIRRRIRAEVGRRVLDPILARDDWHWLGLDGRVHNWLAWICGNVVTAALALDDDPTRRRRVLARAIEGLQRYADALPSDGAIDEGFSYWWNGACRALEALELVERATGGAFTRWRDHPALRSTVSFPAAMHLSDGWFVNVADASARPGHDLAWPSLFRLASSFGDRYGATLALSHRSDQVISEDHRLGRLLLEIHDRDWWSAAPENAAPRPTSTWHSSVQLLVTRERSDGAGLTLVAKGGHNDENHNHNDVGSLIVALDGVPAVVDLGRPTYTARTFSPDRYDIWPMQSVWHSTPRIAGRSQLPGPEFAARAVSPHQALGGVSLDLAGAYDVPGLRSWHRSVELTEGRVRLRDEWDFAGVPDAPSDVALIVAGVLEMRAPDIAAVRPPGAPRPLILQAPGPWTVEERRLDDPLLRGVWGARAFRLSFDVGRSSHGWCEIVMVPGEEVPT